jgi:multiple sugar transport system permease protein
VTETVAGATSRRARLVARRRRRRARELLLAAGFLSPTILLLGVFVIWPAAWAVRVSFMNYSLTGFDALNHRFVGLDNYRALVHDPEFVGSVERTALFVFASAIVGQFVLGLGAALALARKDIRLRGPIGAAIVLPLAVPETVAALAWVSMLAPDSGGTLNRVFGVFGAAPVQWIAHHAMLSIIVVNIWRGIAFAAILFLGAIEGVPQELVDAARADGATPFQILRQITLPLIKHAVTIYMLMTTIGTVTLFGLVFFLTQGGPGSATTLTSIYVYLQSFKFFEFGIGSAATVLLLLFIAPLGVLYVRLLRADI